MAKRELTDREKEILGRIGSNEAAQRSRQVLDLYRKQEEADKAYEEAKKKSRFTGSGIGAAAYNHFDTEGADLLAKKKEADAAVAAFEQSNADSNFRQRASRLTMKQFEQEFAEIERQKQQLEAEKGSFWDALKPGGVTPSQWNASRKEKNAQIEELESKEAKYRAVRDEKKSHEETDMLPDDVKALLDSYNALDTANEGIDFSNMFTPAQQKSHTQINSQKLKNEQQKQAVAEQLKKMGYSNYKELAEYRKYVNESEGTDKFTQEMSDLSKKHPVASTAANLALMPARLMTGAMGTLKGVTDNKETDLGSNPKSTYYTLTRANKEKRKAIGESFEDGVLSANTKKFLYETADSALESLAAGTMFGPASGAMLGLGAMNESVIESLEGGRTSTEALVNGIAAGVFEGLFESLSLGQLKVFKDVPVKTIKDAVKNIGKSVLVNFSEEANTEIANLIFDTMYNGGTSQYYEGVTALMGQGYSEKEARSRVIKDMAKQVGLAGLGGALMGGTFGAYGSAAGAVNYNSQLQETGRQIVDYDNAETLVAGAKDVQGNDKLRQLAEDIVFNERAQQKTELEGKIAGLKEEIAGITDEKAAKEKKKELRALEKEADSLYTKKDYRNVGKASELLAEQTSADRTDVIKKAVSERLKKVGEDNAVVADAIVKKATGKRLTKSEQKAYSSSKKALQVYRELTGYIYDSEWARNLNKDINSLYDRRYNPKLAKTAEPTAPAENEPVVQSKPQTKEYEQKVDNVKVQLKDALLRDGQDKDVLSAAVDLCFEYGRNGGYTLQDAVGSRAISEKIAPEQRKHAYEAGVYQGLKDTANVRYKGDTVSVFVNGFTGKDNISRKSYASAFDVFYSEGAHTAKSFDEALKANSSLLSYIGNGVAQQAFEQGRKFAETESTAPAVSRKKPVVLGGYKSKTLEEKEVDVFFESLAKKLGVNITRVQSINAKNGRRANAYVDINKGEVVSSASSDNEYQSTIHESVHIAYAYNAEKMRPVAKAVKEFFISKHSAVKLEETLRSYEQNYEGDRAAAEEEFIADCIAGMFSTDEGVNDFLSWLEKDSGYNAEEKKTILQKLADWILEIIDAIEELMQGKSLNDVAAEFAKEETARFKEIRQMFLEALDEVAEGTVGRETKNTAESGVKMSIKVTRNMDYAEQIRKYFAGELSRSDSLYLGVPSEMLQKAGFSSNPFAMNQGDLRKSNEKTAKNKKYSRHGVPRNFFKNMPKHLNEAVVFIENENGVTVVTDYFMLDEKEQVSYVIAGVLQDAKMENDTVNLVKSVYPLDDFTIRITKAAETGCLVITDKQKAQTILTTVGVQPSEVSRLFELSRNSLSQNIINVKQKQLDIINKVNPAPNTYSTWIRSVDDIKTLAETLEDSDWADADEFNPDLTREMIEDAIEKGEIKVYSSYPIKQGVFVSPSYMEAESYSGDGNVYSKNVSVDDVAWIDPTQGMYVKFSFAGVKAKTANIDTLDAAQRLEDIGKADAEESTTSIKEQLKNNTEMLNSMNIVGRLNENKVFYNKQGIVTWIVDKLKNTGDTIQRKNFGDIVFDIKRIRNGLRYFKTNEERLALALVPDVLRKGVEIGYHSEHKDRIYDTFTFAAPIEINGVRGNMAVVVRASEKNYYKVHRLLLPDGSQFVFNKKGDISERAGGANKSSGLSPTENISINSIPDSAENVKTSLDWVEFAEKQEKERSAVSKVTELEKIVDELRSKIQHPGVKHIVNTAAVQKVARSLKSGYMSKINVHVLSDELGTLYSYLANENGLNWDNVQIHLENIAAKILDESKYKNPDISEYSKDILREIRSVKIQLNDKQKNAVANKYGSYNEFRKKTMGTLVLSNEGMSLDQRWGELCDKYPMFDKNTSDADQPIVLMDIVASLRQTYEDSYGMDYDSAKEMLMAEIYEQYFEVPETKYISEEYALKLARAKADYGERLKEAKTEFKRQREEAYKKAKAEYGETLKGIREEQQEELLKAKARYNMRAQNIADTRTKEKKRNNIIRNVKRLDKLLRNPGKGAPSAGTNKYGKDYVHLTNIPQEFRKAVIDFCSIFIENDAGVFSGVVKSDNVTVREKKVEQLRKIYEMMQKSESYLNQSVAEEMQKKIDTVAEIMADKRLSQLSIDELDTVIEVTDYITASINAQVAVWVEGKKSTVEKEGKAIIAELEKKGGRKYIGDEAYRIGKALGVNNYKPVYFFERVGGPLEKLFLAIQNDGQRVYARNINAAAAFMESINKKYNYKKWQDEKELVLETVQGHRLKLTKAQAMHIYATARREILAGKDAAHLMQGGIVFEGEIEADTVKVKDERTGQKKHKLTSKVFKFKTENGDAHRIHYDDVTKIEAYLTAEQRAFIDECIKYLSVDMAALGNEISMELYGIKRFNEKYYIPYNSAKNFIYRKMGENGNAMLKNKSFTKETVFGANNPLVVGDFLEVIASHIEEMSMYNAMVLPLDYFNRVWNYNDIAVEDDKTESRKSVRSAMQTAYGSEYVTYIEQLLEDINGGINTDAREKAIDKLTSRFKKTAVLGSASVVIQQPSAAVRAFAEINPIYFAHLPFKGRKEAWERALKYSSTALLKDIGGFDTVSGQSTVDWLTKTEYKGKDKVLKLFTDSEYRDDILAWGPSFADKVTWAHIWKACEKEARANNRALTGEAFYEAVGKRFDEVINKTQVYDSVLTRSAHMRSKSSTMKAVTAFMSEPTTQANMIASAAFDVKNGNKGKAVRKISAVVGSQLFNAVLVSIIYGARDDDENETLAEKYISEVVNNFLSSLNPLSIIPLYKDVVSLMQGFDVKRPDMNIISKFVDAIQKVFSKSDKLSTWDRVSGVIGAVGDIWGIPLTNIIRDSEALLNVAKNIKGIEDTTGKGILYAISDDFAPEFQKLEWYEPSSKDKRLYYAFRDNDEKMYNRLASQYKTGGAIKSALKKQIEENYLEEKLTDEGAIAQLRRLGFSENEAYYEVRKLKEPVAEEESEYGNAAFKSFSEMQTIQSEADAELEAERKEAEDEGETYSEDADYTWLRDKLKAGNKEAIAEEIDLLKEKGVSEDKISSEIKKWLKENDSDVISQAEQSLKGNYSSYESRVKRIADKYGIDESTVASAVRSAAGSSSDSIEGTVYALGDLHFALDKGSEQTISDISKQIFNAKLNLKRNEGEEYDKAYSSVRSGMRSSITSKWKEAYIAGNSTVKAQIRRRLWATGLWDSLDKLYDTLDRWVEE